MCSPLLPILNMVHQYNPTETWNKTQVTFTIIYFIKIEKITPTNKIKTFITQNKPGFENEQTVPQWAQVDSTQKDLVLGYETLLVFHLGSCSHGISLSDYRCTGWGKQIHIIRCLHYHKLQKLIITNTINLTMVQKFNILCSDNSKICYKSNSLL